MSARQSNAVKDNFPNSSDQSATKRNHKKRAGRSFREANYPERSLKCLLCAADDHQADVKNCRGNKHSNRHKERCQDQEENPAEAAEKMRHGALPVPEWCEQSKSKIVSDCKYPAESSTNDRVEKRLAQTSLAFHRGERNNRFAQYHLQRFNKRVKQSFGLSLVPWQAAARGGSFRGSTRAYLRRRCS